MDILNMINQYLKDKKSDDELASEFFSLLKRGESINQIAKQYELDHSKIQEILTKNGYSFNNILSRWEKSESSLNHHQPEHTYYNSKTGTNSEENYRLNKSNHEETSNNESKIEKTNQVQPIPLSLANMLNNGMSIEALCKKYNVTSSEIESALLADGFQYYSFLNHWTKKNSTNFSEELVKLLNHNGNTNALLNRFNIKPQKQNECIQEIKNFLKSNGYLYSYTNNAWEMTATENRLPIIVAELNKTESLKEVAQKFNLTNISLRQLLKNNGYHYYGVLNIWTNKSDKKILEEIVEQLSNETLTLTQLAERNIDIVKLKQALIKEGIQYTKDATDIESKEIQKPIKELDDLKNQEALERNANHVVQESKQPRLQFQFNEEDINSLKEMIQDWKKKKTEEQSINHDPVEINIYLPANLLAQITNIAEKDGMSRSMIISKALQDYLNK